MKLKPVRKIPDAHRMIEPEPILIFFYRPDGIKIEGQWKYVGGPIPRIGEIVSPGHPLDPIGHSMQVKRIHYRYPENWVEIEITDEVES